MKDTVKPPVVILGAGPMGLGAAFRLEELGCHDWLIFERDDDVGGTSRSFTDDHGFTWDLGGHVVFSRYGRFTRLLDDLLAPDEWLHHEREAWIRLMNSWVPYPFQNNIWRLPPEACERCLAGLARAAAQQSNRPFANFGEFIDRTFGEGIATLFMRPYNRKIWAYAPENLAADWISIYVSVPDLERVKRNVATRTDDVGWGPNNRFRFARRGGTGAIWKALAARLPAGRIHLNREAVEVDVDARTVRFADGRKETYGALISALPLDCLARLTGRRGWIEATATLLHSSVHVVGVGLKGKPPESVRTKCWIYFPAPAVPFYRVTHFSKYSPAHVPDPTRQWSLMAEVSESPDSPVDAASLPLSVVRGMADTGLIDGPAQVSHTWVRRIEYGYPTPSLERDVVLRRVLPEMEEAGILSRGRNGSWVYEAASMDHAFMMGYEAAGRALHGTPELTAWDTALINTPHPVLGWNRYR